MTETAEKMEAELSQLSMQTRAELAYVLTHSLDNDSDDNVENAWDIELKQRMQEMSDGIALSTPSQTVLTNLKEKY